MNSNRYLFFVEGCGLDYEVWVEGSLRSEARKSLWNSMSDAEQNAVRSIEWLEDEINCEQ